MGVPNVLTIHNTKLWDSVTNLEDAVDELWEKVDRKKFSNFVNAVKKAKTSVRKAMPFIEENHYNLIADFFQRIEAYKNGKFQLLALRQLSDEEFNNQIDEVNDFIQRNRMLRKDIHKFSEVCLQSFRNKLRGEE